MRSQGGPVSGQTDYGFLPDTIGFFLRRRTGNNILCYYPSIGYEIQSRRERTGRMMKKILIIDEDSSLLKAYREMFKPEEFSIVGATTGQEGLTLVQSENRISYCSIYHAAGRHERV